MMAAMVVPILSSVSTPARNCARSPSPDFSQKAKTSASSVATPVTCKGRVFIAFIAPSYQKTRHARLDFVTRWALTHQVTLAK